jgi:hypothetical protein
MASGGGQGCCYPYDVCQLVVVIPRANLPAPTRRKANAHQHGGNVLRERVGGWGDL